MPVLGLHAQTQQEGDGGGILSKFVEALFAVGINAVAVASCWVISLLPDSDVGASPLPAPADWSDSASDVWR